MSVLAKIETEVQNSNQDEQLNEIVKIRNRPRSRTTKIIKAGSGRTAAIAVAPNLIDISAPDTADGDPIGISVVGGTGTILRGPIGFTNRPGEIRIAGFWVLNDLLLSATPSTIITPIPTMRFSPPLENIAKYVTNTAIIAAMTGAL